MRLIDADELKKQMAGMALISPSYFTSKVVKLLEIIDNQPTVEAVPVVHAKWIYNDFIKEWECSNCHSSASLSDDKNSHPNWCPQCGAKMDGKKVKE